MCAGPAMMDGAMKFSIFPMLAGVLAGVLVAASSLCAAQDQGDWRAASSNARAITGDIEITPTKLFLDFTGFTIAQIRALTPAEISAVFPSEGGAVANGFLYRVNISSTRRFVHKNTLCGSDDTQWMVTSVSGRNLQIALFSSTDAPTLTVEAMNNSSDLCGIFTYSR